MRRQLYAGGGIASLQRQGYGLGDIVGDVLGKAGKVVKQIVKSDVGKAALLGATMYGLGGGKFFGGKGFPGMGQGFSMGNILPNIGAMSGIGKVALGTGAALAFAGIPDPTGDEGFKMAQRKGEVEGFLRRYYKQYKGANWQEGWTQDEEDEFVAKYTNYNQGGRVGLQAGGLPAVDPRMGRTLEENIRHNTIQREMNERIKQGSRTGGLELRNRFVNRVAEGPTGAQMYGINPQAYNMNTPTTPVNEASMYASYLNQGLKPEEIKAIAYYDAMEGRGAGNRLPPIPGPLDPMSMRNIFKSGPELDAHYQEGLRRQMLEGSPEVYFDKEYKLHGNEYLRNLYNKGFEVPGHGTYSSEQEAIDDMGIERYNQLMSKGGRIGFDNGGGEFDEDLDSARDLAETYIREGMSESDAWERAIIEVYKINLNQGGRVGFHAGGNGEGIQSLDAGAPSIKRTGNYETEDSDRAQEMLMAENDIISFSPKEKTFLFKNLGGQGGSDRSFTMPQLYGIISSPNSPNNLADAKALKAFLKIKGFAKGGRVGAFGGGIMGGRVGLRALMDILDEDEEEKAQGGRIGYQYGGGGADYMPLPEGPRGNPAVIEEIEDMREFRIANPGIEDVADYSLEYPPKKKDYDQHRKNVNANWLIMDNVDSVSEIIGIPTAILQDHSAWESKKLKDNKFETMGEYDEWYDRKGYNTSPIYEYFKYMPLEEKEEIISTLKKNARDRDYKLKDTMGVLKEEMASGGRIGYSKGNSKDPSDKPKPKHIDLGVLEGTSLGELIEDMIKWKDEKAQGGRIKKAPGGLMNLGGMEKDYRTSGGFVPIGKKEKADDVPARLSKNEFVMTADAVRAAGGGNINKGAQRMYNTMKQLEGKRA